MDYQNIFGYAATGLSVCFYCALTLPFLNVLRCKSSYEFTPISIIDTIYIDTLVWYIFAEKIECEQLKLSNMIGCCCSLLLIAIYLGFELKKYAIDSILNCLILILGTLVTHKGLTMVVEDPQIIGKFAIAAKLITFSLMCIGDGSTCQVGTPGNKTQREKVNDQAKGDKGKGGNNNSNKIKIPVVSYDKSGLTYGTVSKTPSFVRPYDNNSVIYGNNKSSNFGTLPKGD